MASTNMPESERLERQLRLEREQKRLEINANVTRLKDIFECIKY